MADSIEAFRNVGIKYEFGLLIDGIVYCFNRIVRRASWSKAVTIWLETGFPFWFESQFGERLCRPIPHDGNSQAALFRGSTLGYPDAADGAGLGMEMQEQDKAHPFCWRKVFHAVNPGCFLAPVILRHLPYCETFG